MAKIEVRVPKRGAVQIEGIGFQGPVCRDALAPFLHRIQGQIETDLLKPEFREVNEIKQGLDQFGGQPDSQ